MPHIYANKIRVHGVQTRPNKWFGFGISLIYFANIVDIFFQEASYFDRINMTKNRLEYDQKNNHTDKHERWNLTERLFQRAWMVEHDQNTHENDWNFKVV